MTLVEFALAVLVLLFTPGPTNSLLLIAGAERGWWGAVRLIPAELGAYLAVTIPLALVGARLLAALPAAHALAVPSQTLEAIALKVWKQPRGRVHRIVNGIATAAYARAPDPKAIPGLKRRDDEVVIGAVAGLRAVKDLPALVRAAGGLSGRFRLVIVGEGPERAMIAGAAAAMGIADRVVMPGFVERPYRFLRGFDLVALSSRAEQFPTAVIEAKMIGYHRPA